MNVNYRFMQDGTTLRCREYARATSPYQCPNRAKVERDGIKFELATGEDASDATDEAASDTAPEAASATAERILRLQRAKLAMYGIKTESQRRSNSS